MKRFKVFDAFKNIVKCSINELSYSNVTIDSRNVNNGSIFFAFKGNSTDGHLYIDQAYKNGATCCIISDEKFYDEAKPVVLVKDSLEALKDLAVWNLNNYKGEKIVITGSVGKTSTKAILSLILSQRYKTYEAFKNFNNELGISIVASNLDLNSEIAVFEIGTNNPGEILTLAKFLKPDIGIVTNVGHSHIGKFGDLTTLTKEKLSLSYSIKDDGTIWINDSVDTKLFDFPQNISIKRFGFSNDSDIIIEEINSDQSTYFIVNYNNFRYTFKIDHPYSHFALNSLPAIAIAFQRGFHYEEIYRALEKFSPIEGRGEIIYVKDKVIIDDTYNAGFEAVLSAIENLGGFKYDKYVILGEMAEIDGFEDKLYAKLKELINEKREIHFYLIGERFCQFRDLANVEIFDDKKDLINSGLLTKHGVYLVKASRSRRFEEIVSYLKKGGSDVI